MVYHGRSKACNTCKTRRKKCDETRPSCLRCLKSKRTCPGYESDIPLKVRQYGPPSHSWAPPPSRARKCTIPKRIARPGTSVLPGDVGPKDISEVQINDYSLRAFFYDYCIIPSNSALSRGYLQGLETLVTHLGPDSILSKACRAVSFGARGQALQRPALLDRGETLHQECLEALAGGMVLATPAAITEYQLVAMMLGLYQMATAETLGSGNHQTHARGLAALLRTGQFPLSVVNLGLDEEIFGIPLGKGAFSMSASEQTESLDDLVRYLARVWVQYRSRDQTTDVHQLRESCLDLQERLDRWEKSLRPEVRPATVTRIEPSDDPEIAVGFWPGNVDTYLDLYIAGVWNIARTTRLLTIAIIMGISDEHDDNNARLIAAAEDIIKDIIASIPYHLADNVYELASTSPSVGITATGRTVGGFLLLHPLYIASRMPFIAAETQGYLRGSLEWMAENMGIAQAGALVEFVKAEDEEVNDEYIISGCLILWFGFCGLDNRAMRFMLEDPLHRGKPTVHIT